MPQYERISDYALIDFDGVIHQFSALAAIDETKKRIEQAAIISNPMELKYKSDLAREAIRFEQQGLFFSLPSLTDAPAQIRRAEKEMVLSGYELSQMALLCSAIENVADLFEVETFPGLSEVAGSMEVLRPLRQAIEKAIDLSGQLKNNASGTLVRLNDELISAKASVSKAARQFVKSNENDLMDTTVSFVNSRACVLVKNASKNRFGGMIHGMSSSRQAFYLEPSHLVDLNNEVAALQAQIEDEKKKILASLSRRIKEKSRSLLSSIESLSELDEAFAKARWAVTMDGCMPVISESSRIRLEHAAHPLLKKESTVYNYYRLDEDQRILMITGPNMGGKTITLKTIALSILLGLCGYPVRAHRAIIPHFKRVLFDIGDQQSVAGSLSTFSAHISNLSAILKEADEDTFILLDELGSGTEPQHGAAIAQAVIEQLLKQKTHAAVSTHYNELKAFGKSQPSILLSSVEFDLKTFMPTYRYLSGVSGASYAFDIAKRLNMPDALIERAKVIKDENEPDILRQMEALEKAQMDVQHQKDRFTKMIADAHALQKEADEQKEKWKKRRQALDEEYRDELDAMLEEKREEAKNLLQEIKDSSNMKKHEQIAAIAAIDALDEGEKKPKKEKVAPDAFKPGDYVHIELLNNHGEIISIKKDKATVMVNGKRTTVGIDNLKKIKRPKVQSQPKKTGDRTFKAFPLELNLIGMRVAEGMDALDRYLDQAVYHHVRSVRIIHGMGTGAMRNAVWDNLRRQSIVKSFSAAGPAEGGLGATLVEL